MTRLTTVKRSIGRYGAAMGLIIATSLIGSSMARAQATPVYPTAFTVNYFNNPGTAGLDEIYIQNETNNGNSIPGTTVCALLYAFLPDQEMIGCCGVAITPNETWGNSIGQLMIHLDVASPLPTKGTIKVVATTLSADDVGSPVADADDCNPSFPFTDGATLAPHTLNSWITHTNTFTTPSGTFMTEEPFAQTGEPTGDLTLLANECETVDVGTCAGSQ